jgi:hypothetical protein
MRYFKAQCVDRIGAGDKVVLLDDFSTPSSTNFAGLSHQAILFLGAFGELLWR